ncbi:MAG: liaR [Frankiales bacterium]|nr:liaR [Frankiales bacterium]
MDSVPTRRSEIDLVSRQLAGIRAWTADQHTDDRDRTMTLTREMRLDAARRLDARRREQAAVLARAAEHLSASGQVLASRVPLRAVLAHRNTWLRDRVAAGLRAAGVEVVGEFEDGADAAGTVVVEQPDIVLVEDRLPTVPGLEVVRRVRLYSPNTLVGAQVMDGDGVGDALDAGAQAVFTRRTPPGDIAKELLRCLAERPEQPVVV